MSKHSDLANRIFRTVVFSGAMLGAAGPVLAEAPANPTARKAPAKPADTWESVSSEIEATNKKLDAAILDYVAARKALAAKEGGAGTATAITSSKVEQLRKARTALDARLAKTTRRFPRDTKAWPAVEKAEAALATAEATLFAALDAEPRDDAGFIKVTAEIEAAQKARVAAATKVRTERANASRRPRTSGDERPRGRGFILA